MNLIYGLIDPRTNEVRYIGKSTSGMTRPLRHTQPSHMRIDSYKTRWLRELMASGFYPDILTLEETARDDLAAAEREWICNGRALGWPLTNLTDGGDGALNPSPATRAKLSAAGKRNKSRTGQPMPDWHRKVISAANKGRKHTAEHRRKITETRRARGGYAHSDAAKQRISASKRGAVASEETKQKMSAVHLGFRHTEESREKMRRSWALRKEKSKWL